MAFSSPKPNSGTPKRPVPKLLCLVTALSMAVSFTACQSGEAASQQQAAVSYTGTISAIQSDSITITTQDQGDVTLALTSKTTFARSMGGPGQGAPEGEQPTSGETPPEMPEGGAPAGAEGEGQGGQPASGETPPEMPEGGMPQETLTYEDLAVGDTVTVTLDANGAAETVTLSGGMGGGPGSMGGGPGGAASSPDSYDAANEYTQDTTLSNTALTSTGTDENALLVQTAGIRADLDGVTITRTSADSTGGDSSSFYGVGAAALVTDGTLSIQNSTITTDAAGGAGVFAYGSGTAYVSDTTITTQQDTSGGIHVAGGGTLYAWDLTVETSGESSAAIRSDRGSGTMVVDGGSYTSNGVGSPAVYSTADITIHDASLTATGSEAICIEGLNTIRLFDCDLTGNMSDLAQNDCTWNVILYQSMSGDSQVGNSTFQMVGGSLTANNGGMFYTTNTESTFLLSGVEITNAADSEFLLKCTGNSNQRGWGTAGANGADCHFTAIDQILEGDVIWDSISQLDFYLTEGSTLTGAVLQDESNAGSGGDGYANLYLDASSQWIVTGSSTLTSLSCAGSVVDENGAPVSIQGADGTVYVSGSSPYTVTVEQYSASADTSGASTLSSWSDFAVDQA